MATLLGWNGPVREQDCSAPSQDGKPIGSTAKDPDKVTFLRALNWIKSLLIIVGSRLGINDKYID